jgi:Kef-type K+ transport system membrane component KefB
MTTFLDLAVVLLAARLGGAALRRLGQPAVIGEILAGVALGPSLIDATQLFSAGARPAIATLGQAGLVLFMFLVGLELDLSKIPRASAMLVVGAGSALLPFVAGLALAPLLYAAYPPDGFGRLGFSLFMGVALAITAFPVLARILEERRLHHTPLGVVALGAAAINDLLAWCLLAGVLALVGAGTAWRAVLALGGTAAFACALWRLVPALVGRLRRRGAIVIAAAAGALTCAWVTEHLGTHVIFGAFLLGVVWPRGEGARVLNGVLRPLGDRLLLPFFFVAPGLALHAEQLGRGSVGYFGLILAAAAGAKLVGATVAGRLAGFDARAALMVGALMNTRGLMELIVLNVGLQLGLLDGALYTLLVAMAIVTTVMTDPLLRTVRGRLRPQDRWWLTSSTLLPSGSRT